MRKSVSIFGSTGSIGCSTVDLIAHNPDLFDVKVLTGGANWSLLADQALALRPKLVVLNDETHAADLTAKLSGSGIELAFGRQAICDAAKIPVDLTVAAIMGFAGLAPLLESVKVSKAVAIANKEPLVAAGDLFTQAAQAAGCQILPTDSEHNAIFQVFEPENRGAIKRLILTASGGPFRTWAKDAILKATPEQAVKHPNWSMGAKISVDSASLMNKALEVIEAHYLFDMPADKIDVLVHPQSIIHSMVEYIDGSVLAQMGAPDMRTPIAYCLSWPERMQTSGESLDVLKLSRLEFEEARHDVFPTLGWAYDALRSGAGACIALNAANEVAVAEFLNKKIDFAGIFTCVEKMLENFAGQTVQGLEDIVYLDDQVRNNAKAFLKACYGLSQ